VAIAVDHLVAAVDDRRTGANLGYAGLDGRRIIGHERAAAAGAAAHAGCHRATRHDPDEVLAKRVELCFDGGLAAGAQCHCGHDSRDSDADAEAGKKRAEAVARQRGNRHSDGVEIHGETASYAPVPTVTRAYGCAHRRRGDWRHDGPLLVGSREEGEATFMSTDAAGALRSGLHEDPDLQVVDKPAGLVVHPSKDGEMSSLIGRVRLYLGHAEGRLVNRIDRETTGLVIVAKQANVAKELGQLFAGRDVTKRYLAVVHGYVAPGH